MRVLVAAGVLLAAHTAAAQTARTIRVPSPEGGQRVFAVLLPASYDTGDARYPVLFLLHGGGQDHTAFASRSRIMQAARRMEMIVVMPAADRAVGSRGADAMAAYEDYLARDLVAYVDANYRTDPNPTSRAIAGISQGGMFAATTALRHPGVFGTVGAFSAAFRAARVAQPPAATQDAYFYVSCGTADSLLQNSRDLVALLASRTIGHEFHAIPGGQHDWSVWDGEAERLFDLLVTRQGWTRRLN